MSRTVESLRSEAQQVLTAFPDTSLAMRSCWDCNPAHEYLRDPDDGEWILYCFECGRYLFRGVDITIYEDRVHSSETP